MWCGKCGNELMDGARFCGRCGAPVETEANAQFIQPAGKKKGKKKLLIWLASIVAVVAVVGIVLYFALSSPSLRLKYDWGTSDETIIDNETVVDTHEYWSDQEFYIQCENPDGRIGNLEGYSCDYVNYRFYDGKLCQIFASFNERYTSWEEYIEQIEKTLGKEHYDKWIFNRYVWWIGDTIIEFDVRNRLIGFSEQGYFQEYYGDSKDYQEMAAFFGK